MACPEVYMEVKPRLPIGDQEDSRIISRKKKILYVDMDGVIADFEKGVQFLCSEPIDWGIDNWNETTVDKICSENVNIFDTLPEIEGGIDAVCELKEHYEVYFLSTPMQNIPESYMGKRKWLKEKFGNWADKRLILTHRKDLNKGDILIDDRLKNGTEFFDGIHIHFGTRLFPNWNSVLKYLI